MTIAQTKLHHARLIMDEIDANDGHPVYISIDAAAAGRIEFVAPNTMGSAQWKDGFASTALTAAEHDVAMETMIRTEQALRPAAQIIPISHDPRH
jgi:hypothetical protein